MKPNLNCVASSSGRVKWRLLFIETFCIAFVFLSLLSLSPVLYGQPSNSVGAIPIGSKFQVNLEFDNHVIVLSRDSDTEKTFKERVIGEVQLYTPPPNSIYGFHILGLGHGTHESTIAHRPLSSDYPPCEGGASGEFNVIFTGYIADDENGNAIVSVSALPIPSEALGKNLTETASNYDLYQYLQAASSEYTVFGSCQSLSIPSAIPIEVNISKSKLQEGIIWEKKAGTLEDLYGVTTTKLNLSPPAVRYDISGTVKSDNGLPISNSKVVIVDFEELKKKIGKNYSPSMSLKLSDLNLPFEQKTATSDDENAKYTFTINGKGRVMPSILVVSLLWYDKEKGGGSEFAVTTGPEKKDGRKIPIYTISCISNLYREICQPWKPNIAKDSFQAELNFVYGDIEHLDLEKEDLYPRSPSRTQTQYDAANVYYNSYKAIKYFESLKGQVHMALNPVIIDIYNTVDPICLDEKTKADIDNAFFRYEMVRNIGGLGPNLEPVEAKGGFVGICKKTSSVEQYDAPMNREYHELGHYLQRDMHYPAIPYKPGGKSHAGYENSDSNNSVVEGFASFVALLIKEHYQSGTNTQFMPLYPGGRGSTNMEQDIKVWGDHIILKKDSSGKIIAIHRPDDGDPDDEEDAVDGILWDLHDNTKETSHSKLSTLYKISKDDVSLSDSKILMIISNFKPMDLVELYEAFDTIVPKASLDMLFINHGAFGDTAIHNLVHEYPNELPGHTGDTRVKPDRTHRLKVPTIPGSYIEVEKDATFNVSMIHDPPYSDYDFSYLDNMTKGELVYFKMSPPYYPSKAVFDQVSPNGNKTLADNVLVIDSDDYWNYIHSHPANYSIFKTVPVPVAVPSFPVDLLRNLNATHLNNANITHNEISFKSNIQQGNVYPSIDQNNSNLNPNSNLNLPLIEPNKISPEVNPQRPTENSTLILPLPLHSANKTLTASIASPHSKTNSTFVTIDLVPESSPLFYNCNQTTANGSSTLPGLNVSASFIRVLTDANPDTHISGNATFDIIFEKPLADMPGPDLIINETGTDTEFYSMEALSKNNKSLGAKMFVSNPTMSVDACGNFINTFQIDFQGLPHEGDTILGLRIDNDPDRNGGAELSDISTVHFGPLLMGNLSETNLK
jgi:hypothetical protein